MSNALLLSENIIKVVGQTTKRQQYDGLELFYSEQQKSKQVFFCIEDEEEEYPHKNDGHRTMSPK